MSFDATKFRPFAKSAWGHRATFRGAQGVANDTGGQVGTVVYRSPGVRANTSIIGVTRDSAGSPIGPCAVNLFNAADVLVRAIPTDASGNFTFEQPGSGPFYIVAYKAGSPDIAGTTVNTLIAA